MDYMGIILNGLELGQKPFIKEHFLRELSKGIKDGYNVDELIHGMRRGYNFLKLADHLNPDKGEPRIIGNRKTGFPSRFFITAEDLNLIETTLNEVEGVLSEAEPDKLTFPDYLIPSSSGTTEDRRAEVMALAEKIKSILPIKKPKDAAAVYWVLHKAGKISITQPTPAYNVMKEYFGNIGSSSGFTKYFKYDNTSLICFIEDGFINHYSDMIFE